MYLTAAMLTGAAMFTSCSNEDDMGNVNPTYDGESVKTQFAINIPYTSNANTRMSADNTQSQGTPTFLGMYNIKLIPMTETGADNKDFTSILSLTAFSAFDNNADDQNSGFRKVYSDVNVPVGTKNFLFYGAGGADAPTTANDKFAEGIINANITGSNTKDISFALEGAKGTDTNNECTKLITVLNNVASVANWSTSGNAILKELYTNFITLKAGSANSICKTLERLYNEVDVLATVTGTPESAETTIAKAIQAAIIKDNTFTKSGSSCIIEIFKICNFIVINEGIISYNKKYIELNDMKDKIEQLNKLEEENNNNEDNTNDIKEKIYDLNKDIFNYGLSEKFYIKSMELKKEYVLNHIFFMVSILVDILVLITFLL